MIRPSRQHRGSTYLVVLGAATLVAIFGLMSICQQRIQRRSLIESNDMCQARWLAQIAIRLGILTIQSDSDWRSTFSESGANDEVDLNFGTFALEVTDPYDGDLTDDATDPILLTGIGRSGDAEQRMEMTLHAKKRPHDCLQYAFCINDSMLDDTDATIRADRPMSARIAEINSGHLYADVEAETISGTTYHGQTTVVSSEDRVTVPAMDAIVEYYLANGTTININQLPLETPNLIKNADMERGDGDDQPIDDWYPPPNPPNDVSCELVQDDSIAYSGTYSLFVKNREAWNAGPVQFVDDWVQPGSTYTLGVWIYSTSTCWYGFAWYTKGTQDSGNWIYSSTTYVSRNAWRYVTVTMTSPGWSGDLEMSFIKIRNASGTGEPDFYIDDITIKESILSSQGRFFYRQLLSPNHNPFSVSTNPEGIYIIDCAGLNLFIERSRILGTLVLKNPGSGTQIRSGPIHCSPAVPGYPAIIVYKTTLGTNNLAIGATRAGLSEADNGVNFNPAGAGYDSLGEDADMNDTLPSEIRGLVIVGGDISFSGDTLIRGAVLGNDDLLESHGTLRIDHDPTVLHNPPPGFDSEIEMISPAGATNKGVQ